MGNSLRVDPFNADPKVAELRARKEAINKEVSENWHSREYRAERAQEMAESIYWGFAHENLLSLYGNVENVAWDGRVFERETRGLRAFYFARGGYIEASTLHSEIWELPRDQVGFHVYETTDKLRSNFAETSQDLIDHGTERLDAVINQRAIALFQTGIPSTSPYYSASAGLSLAQLDLAIRQIRDVAQAPGLTGPPVSILGRATMTDQIVSLIMGSSSNGAGFLPETNERLLALGVLGVYRGARIITLNNYQDDADVSFFPANELYVVGRNATKFAFFGGLEAKEFEEDDNWVWHFLAKRETGAALIRPSHARRILDTSQAA